MAMGCATRKIIRFRSCRSQPGRSLNSVSCVSLSVNFHFTQRCNYKCAFCFLNRSKTPLISFENAKIGLNKLKDAGVEKLNFAGGEPFMHPKLLGQMVQYCKEDLGIPWIQITSNARLIRPEWVDKYGECVDFLTVSIDSFDEAVNKSVGRGRGDHTLYVSRAAELCRTHDVKLKINTVIYRDNFNEDMHQQILQIDPFRWKVIQMYLVDGLNKNTGDKNDVTHLGITREEFLGFVERHEGISCLQAEPNERFVNAYLLLNERMSFLNTEIGNVESDSILLPHVDVATAIAQCGFSKEQFLHRGGNYFYEHPTRDQLAKEEELFA